MNLESPTVIVEKSSEYLFNALSDVTNYEKLMPDNIAKFEVLGDDIFNFGLSGMPEIKLRLKEGTSNSKIVLVAASDKLPFSLNASIVSRTNVGSYFSMYLTSRISMRPYSCPIKKV